MIDGFRNNPPGPFTARSLPARAGGADPATPVRRVAAAPATDRPNAGLVEDLAKAPPVDAVRVASLKAAIAGGSYRIDPDAIAAAMLRLDRGRP